MCGREKRIEYQKTTKTGEWPLVRKSNTMTTEVEKMDLLSHLGNGLCWHCQKEIASINKAKFILIIILKIFVIELLKKKVRKNNPTIEATRISSSYSPSKCIMEAVLPLLHQQSQLRVIELSAYVDVLHSILSSNAIRVLDELTSIL